MNGYLIVVEEEKQAAKSHIAHHLQELMVDTELYEWNKVRACHAVLLNQLEQCSVKR